MVSTLGAASRRPGFAAVGCRALLILSSSATPSHITTESPLRSARGCPPRYVSLQYSIHVESRFQGTWLRSCRLSPTFDSFQFHDAVTDTHHYSSIRADNRFPEDLASQLSAVANFSFFSVPRCRPRHTMVRCARESFSFIPHVDDPLIDRTRGLSFEPLRDALAEGGERNAL